MRPPRILLILVALSLSIAGLYAATAQELTSIAAVRALTPAEADEHRRVRLRGVATYYNPAQKIDLVLQDGDHGIFVGEFSDLDLSVVPGDLVEISGITYWGVFAQNIRPDRVTVVGSAPLPEPRPAGFEELASGALDCVFIETRGIVRRAWVDWEKKPERLMLEVASGGQQFSAWILNFDRALGDRLVDAEVTVRGVCFHLFNQQGQSFAFRLMVATDEQVRIEKPAPLDPYAAPERSANSLFRHGTGEVLGHRIKVRGKVLAFFPGEALWIRDATQGLLIKTSQGGTLQPGDEVEALGFPSAGEFNPCLADGVFRVVGSGAPPDPIPIAVQNIFPKDGDLVRIKATVINGLSQPEQDILMLQDGPSIFRATLLRGHGALPLQDLRSGTQVELTGICAVTAGDVQSYMSRLKPETFRIVLRQPSDVAVIAPAPWITREWVVRGSVVLAALLIVALSWAISWALLGTRKNRQLRVQVAATKAAEDELQKAHDGLELRVQQRTQELHAQITARQETEVRFAAISTERARLARELHDSLEQVLTGTALQLNAASDTIHADPIAAAEHIEIARHLMRQTRTEVRRSVWDLRAQSLETHDLGQALQKAAQHLTGSGVDLLVTTSGQTLRLTDVLENHLLRIGQEAVTNAVKHGKAGRILLHIAFSADKVTMTVEDNGCGFDADSVLGVEQGHFGLEGMMERVKRIGGTLAIESSLGGGTKLIVETPLEPHLLETYSA